MNKLESIEQQPIRDRPLIVLMVEDDPSYRTFVCRVLRQECSARFEFVGVGSLKECGNYLSNEIVDVILLDLNLPDSSGLATIKRISELGCGIPIVILSGSDDSESGLLSVGMGAQDYLVKHQVSNGALVRSIRYAIERRKFEESTIRLSAIRDFMQTLAHDLQIPMIGAANVFDALSSERLANVPDELVKILSALKESNQEQLKLVRKLLELYKYEIDASQLVFVKQDLKLILLQTSLVAFDKRLNLLVTRFPKQLPVVWGDQDAICWLFSNLFDNALKFADPGTKVEVTIEELDESVCVHIHNFGAPIPDDVRERLFAGFWQGVPGRTYVARTGMGLYLCQRIVSTHRGRLLCKSSENGTTMTVRFPKFSQS